MYSAKPCKQVAMSIKMKVSIPFMLFLLLCSCRDSSDSVEFLRTNQLPRIQLIHQTTIQDSESLSFMFISTVVSDNEGTIFIADGRAYSIYVFDSNGNYLQSLGREGSGPGEFRSILSMFMDSNKQLFVNDISSNKTNIFARIDDQWKLAREYSSGSHRYSVVAASPSGNLGLRKSPFQQPDQGAYWYEHEMGYGDLYSDKVVPDRHQFKERGQLVHESGLMIGIPFGRETLLTSDLQGQIYLLWTDTFEVAVYDSQINPMDSIRANLPNLEVTTEEREQYFNRVSQMFYGLAERYMPDTKPVARKLIVDPAGRLWVQTYDSPEYLVLNNKGIGLGSFDLSENESLMHVDAQRIYTRIMDESGTRVLVYEYILKLESQPTVVEKMLVIVKKEFIK